jgi:hypothetical protein
MPTFKVRLSRTQSATLSIIAKDDAEAERKADAFEEAAAEWETDNVETENIEEEVDEDEDDSDDEG